MEKPHFKIYLKQELVLFSPQNRLAQKKVIELDCIPVSIFRDRFEPCYIKRLDA